MRAFDSIDFTIKGPPTTSLLTSTFHREYQKWQYTTTSERSEQRLFTTKKIHEIHEMKLESMNFDARFFIFKRFYPISQLQNLLGLCSKNEERC